MGIRVGIPVLKLSVNGKATKRGGNAKSVAEEMMNERYSKDSDLDRSLSHLNTYTGFKSGKELYEYWTSEADKCTDKLGRHLRSDAIIGFSIILKPNMESMQNMSDTEQEQFNSDGVLVLNDLLTEHGLQVDATATHRDEMNLHTHLAGHDVNYQAGKKLNLQLFKAFNKEFPKRMRKLGYDVEDISVYDAEKVKGMTPEEQEVYKSEHIKRKQSKKHGQSSNAYKEQKIAEAEKKAQEMLSSTSTECDILREDALRQADDIIEQARLEALKRTKELSKREKYINERERSVNQSEVEIKAKQQQVEDLQSKAVESLKTADMTLQDATKSKSLYLDAYDNARAIANGIASDVFYNRFTDELKSSCERVNMKNGGTAWDSWSKYIIPAIDHAKQRVDVDSPEKVYEERVSKRVAAADKEVNVVHQRLDPFKELTEEWERNKTSNDIDYAL